MGMDGLEILLEIEDAFSVTIPDTEAEKMTTVGALYDWLVEQMKAKPDITEKSDTETPNAPCLSSITFNTLRCGLKNLGVVSGINISTEVEDWMPKDQRRNFWSRLGKQCDLKLPRLVRPKLLVRCCSCIVMAAALLTGFATYSSGNGFQSAFAVVALGILVLWAIAYIATIPFAIHLAPECTNMRGLSETVFEINYKKLSKEHGVLNENDVWIVLRTIIVKQLSVDPDEVTPNARFVEDLGCD